MRIKILALSLNSFKSVVGGRANWLEWLWKRAAESLSPPSRTGGKSEGRGKPKWNYGELSLPNWWGFIRHCQGQRIEVISFFMHGFCPHGDLKRRQRERVMREYSGGERWEERGGVEMREKELERRREGEGKQRQGEGRRKVDEWEGETIWQPDV